MINIFLLEIKHEDSQLNIVRSYFLGIYEKKYQIDNKKPILRTPSAKQIISEEVCEANTYSFESASKTTDHLSFMIEIKF